VSVTAFDPVRLPLDRVWMSGTREARLELRAAGADADGQSLAYPSPAACVHWSDARVGVRVTESGAAGDPARGAMLVLVADEPGRVLQMSMPSTRERPRATAESGIVVLDRHADGRVELGVVRADAAGAPLMRRGSIGPGEVWEVGELLGAPRTFRVELALLAPGSASW
jgi:hypothetical protein